MEFFSKTTQINFLGQRRIAIGISILLLSFSLLSLAANGLCCGLEVTGGMQLQLTFKEPIEPSWIRDQLKQLKQIDLSHAQIQNYGSAKVVSITLAGLKVNQSKQSILKSSIQRVLQGAEIQSMHFVGPHAGSALLLKGILAMVLAFLGMMFYISFRFEYRLAVGAIIALIHDSMISLGVWSGLRLEFNLISVTAILTVIGYSVNNIIVIFDRIRENFKKLDQAGTLSVVNLSINETLSRS